MYTCMYIRMNVQYVRTFVVYIYCNIKLNLLVCTTGSGTHGLMAISIHTSLSLGGPVLSGQRLWTSRPIGPTRRLLVQFAALVFLSRKFPLFRPFSHLLFSMLHLLLECCPTLPSLPGCLRDGSTIEEPGPSGVSSWMTRRRGPLVFGTLYALERQIEDEGGHGTSLLGPVSVSSVRHDVVHWHDFWGEFGMIPHHF